MSINRLFEFIHICPFLKSMAADAAFAALPRSRFFKFRSVNLINDFLSLRFELTDRLILFSGEVCVLGTAGLLASRQRISVGEVVFFQVLFLSVLNSFSSLFQLLPMWETFSEARKSIAELHQESHREDCCSGKKFTVLSGNLCARNVSFRYPGSDRMIFEDFSCEILPGSIVAVTGANGRGKTTLFKLLTGYLTPAEGEIRIGNAPLAEFSRESFRDHISYVFQDSLLVTGTLKDNITLRNLRYTHEDISRALSLSGADSVVARMPEGLEHKIHFDGCDLSGGERQKIAIARALIRKPEILVFDEVTNHLDYTSRMKMRDLIVSLRGKVTIFLVSHDPELVALCDKKIDLEQQEGVAHA